MSSIEGLREKAEARGLELSASCTQDALDMSSQRRVWCESTTREEWRRKGGISAVDLRGRSVFAYEGWTPAEGDEVVLVWTAYGMVQMDRYRVVRVLSMTGRTVRDVDDDGEVCAISRILAEAI